MREILFRGQTRKNGEKVEMATGEKLPGHWVYGGIFPGTGDYSIIYGGETEKDLERHIAYSETVGQYTGLNDKNGNRIFEGDIVKTSDITHEGVIQIPGESFEIAMRKGCWVMVAGEDWDFLETNHECIQVIGNIHDNPELLKGGEG